MSICKGIAGKRNGAIKGIFIHNDAGSQNANAAFYKNWLQSHDLTNGFAHYYVASDGVLQAEDDAYMAWHCGNLDGNSNYLSFEVCQSMGDLATFKANEEATLKLCAEKCKQYGITPSNETIRLHQEVYATSCPHRSVEIHGGQSATKGYFVKRIKELMNDTVVTSVNVTLQKNIGSDSQRWSIIRKGDYVQMKNKKTGFYLDLAGASTKNETNIQAFKPNGTDAQLWKIVKKSHGEADYILFEPKIAVGKYASVAGNNIGGNIKLYEDLKSAKQKFYLRQESDGYYILIHAHTAGAVTA